MSDGQPHIASSEPSPGVESGRSSLLWILFFFFVPVHSILLVANVIANSATADEPAHLASGVAMWRLDRFDVYTVNPPLVRLFAAAPAALDGATLRSSHLDDDPGLRPEWAIGQDFAREAGRQVLLYVILGRLACLPFSIVGLLATAAWATERLGNRSGIAAAALWTFSPMVLAHGALFTSDVASGALGIVALTTFDRWLRAPTFRNSLAAGLALGFAEATKITVVVLFPLYIAVWCGQRLIEYKRNAVAKVDRRPSWQSESIQLGLLLTVGVLILNATYKFTNVLVPLESLTFYSRALGVNSVETDEADESKFTRAGNRFRNTLLGQLPVALASPYLQGLDIQRRDFEGGWRAYDSYAAGIKAKHGWWWYYFYCAAVKCPLAALCLIVLAIPATLRWVWAGFKEPERLSQAVIPLVITTLIVSETSFSRCFRYLLVVWPFFIVVLSTAFSSYAKPVMRKAATLVLIAYGVTSFAATPQHLSFFNSFAGGPLGGHNALLDSNLDWGQELFRLRAWRTEHSSDSLFLAISGTIDPGILGMHYERPPVSTPNVVPHLEPGWYIVSANLLHGFDAEGESWEYFQHFEPVDRIGHTMFVFKIIP